MMNWLYRTRRAWRASGLVALRKLLRATQGPSVVGLLLLLTMTAHANGRIPGATGLAIHPTDARQLLLGLSYGLALSRDAGASWTWMCEGHIEGNGGDVDPSIAMTSDGTLLVLSLTNGGVLVSRDDGCSFERAMGPLAGNRGVDLTLDPSQPGRVLALTSTIVGEVERKPLYRNLLAQSLDHGRSWSVLAELPEDLSAETVEVAASDPRRMYVSGTASGDPLQGIVERSDDGGLHWQRSTVQLPRGSGSLYVSGIHPSDPQRVWFRVPARGDVYGVLPARLWRSTDGAASFDQVADTQAGMLGFAVSPDGTRIVFGGPLDGLFIAPSDASAAPTKLSDMQVKCLRWVSGGLYACAGEPSDPYSLGYAKDPTQGFVPLWHRADTCRDTCAAPSSLELTCHDAWEVIAPFIDAGAAVCDGSSSPPDAGVAAVRDAGIEAGPGAVESDLDGSGAAVVDAPIDALIDASPPTPEVSEPAPPAERSEKGCTVTFAPGISTPWWLAPVFMLAGWMRRPRRSALLARLDGENRPRVVCNHSGVREEQLAWCGPYK
jgi:hypothetical protein